MTTNGTSSPRVVIFTSPTCHWCRVAKTYCTENEIAFEEIDIVRDLDGRKQMVLMTGQHGVPVIQVGSLAMVGWDKEEFETLRARSFKRR